MWAWVEKTAERIADAVVGEEHKAAEAVTAEVTAVETEVKHIATEAETAITRLASEVYHYRFSLASGAMGVYDLEQLIAKHLKGE